MIPSQVILFNKNKKTLIRDTRKNREAEMRNSEVNEQKIKNHDGKILISKRKNL